MPRSWRAVAPTVESRPNWRVRSVTAMAKALRTNSTPAAPTTALSTRA
jgi:hypothetical protein